MWKMEVTSARWTILQASHLHDHPFHSRWMGLSTPPHPSLVLSCHLICWRYCIQTNYNGSTNQPWTVQLGLFLLFTWSFLCTLQNSYINGNGSSKDYHGGSKPNRSFCGVTKIGSGLSHASSSASASSSTSLVRPMGIPDSSKRPKLTFLIGQGKPVRPAQTQSSPNCSLSSASHPQPTSSSSSMSTSGFPQVKQVNGTHTGASFLVPYGQESSEESDQEAGALENGSAKPYLAPDLSNGNGVKDDAQSHNSSSLPQLTSIKNGSNGFHVRENGSEPAHKSQNGLPKANGFNHTDKVQHFKLLFCGMYIIYTDLSGYFFIKVLLFILFFSLRLWALHILHPTFLMLLIVQNCNSA